jgi:peroxiredoxin/RNA polymerase-interacting CarD/CdnL/TRCF family regulator
MRFALSLVAAAALAFAAFDSPTLAAGSSKPIPSLSGVSWEGAGASLDDLKGKTVVVLTYVTWCPICNGWAPEMLSQVQEATKDKPVIVLAISTDTPPAKAKEYMQNKGFTGPNILHGYEPKLAKSFGFDNEFFNYAIVGPQGDLVASGNAGLAFAAGNGKSYVLPKEFEKIKDFGKFRFVDTSMSAGLQEMLWPMELGYIAEVQRSLKKAEKTLKPDDREKLKTSIEQFLDDELKSAKELAEGDASQKIEALGKASFLSANFKSNAQGKEAKKVLADLTKDKSLKKEISAKKMYDQSMQMPDPDRRVVMLEKAARQFPDTHYGELADKAARAAKR